MTDRRTFTRQIKDHTTFPGTPSPEEGSSNHHDVIPIYIYIEFLQFPEKQRHGFIDNLCNCCQARKLAKYRTSLFEVQATLAES